MSSLGFDEDFRRCHRCGAHVAAVRMSPHVAAVHVSPHVAACRRSACATRKHINCEKNIFIFFFSIFLSSRFRAPFRGWHHAIHDVSANFSSIKALREARYVAKPQMRA